MDISIRDIVSVEIEDIETTSSGACYRDLIIKDSGGETHTITIWAHAGYDNNIKVQL